MTWREEIADVVEDGASDPIERAFWQFHHDHPEVYAELRLLALRLRDRGHGHYGIKALFEVVRFERAMLMTDDDSFKLNNNYSALYARLLMKEEPRLKGFFELRARISRRCIAEAAE